VSASQRRWSQLNLQPFPSASYFIVCASIVVYLLGIAIGIGVVEQRNGATLAAALFFAAQIPLIVSPAISYQLATGAFLYLVFEADRIAVPFSIGSTFSFFVGGSAPVSVGVNVLASVGTYVMWRASRQQRGGHA
jgi:hypothetical protein